ncbi:MgtC/SapB family protein [uncultured Spirosoma sp.]|uniref:MgtC/SapB family protein n=1 Tax=uncultured Spirosoma sp. TaxID=278208 RepID=UPI002586BD5E|nr:MgtC/SapB family protein [uncultured Spirosoma sp.]
MTTLLFAERLVTAMVFGALVGFERQWQQKSAGLRTNTLVSLGAAAFMLLSVAMTGDQGDPTRIAGQIVTGIGFLGAGVIMRNGLTVQGLNTAATIWCSAAVGCLCGVGLPGEAAVTTGAIVLTHLLLRPLGTRISRGPVNRADDTQQTDYLITVQCRESVENHIRVLLMQYLTGDEDLLLHSLTSSDNDESATVLITAEVTASGQPDQRMERIVSRLTIEQQVIRVSWALVGQQVDL